MTKPGVASRVVREIMAFAGDLPTVKVDVSKTVVTVTFVTPTQAIKAYSWVQGQITLVDSDVVYIAQATFDPRGYNFYDVGALFAKAAELGASTSEPQLQIVEHDPGEVLMTVTTRPESATVFFRKDGTPIRYVDFETSDGLAEGLQDAIGQRTATYAVGYLPGTGTWADLPGPSGGTILKRIRPEKLPAYSALRNQTISWPTFDPQQIDARLISQLRANLRAKYQVSLSVPMTISVDGRYRRSAPTITFSFGGTTVVTDLKGTDITSWVLGK